MVRFLLADATTIELLKSMKPTLLTHSDFFSSPLLNGAILSAGVIALTAYAVAQPVPQETKPTTEPAPEEASTEITVTARKQPENLQDAPLSDTVITRETIANAGVRNVKEASQYVPNAFIVEFSARKLSNPRFRGIGASPLNPGVTTYFDGVPQFNANSSSIELLDVDQIEFVRGPQGALFGRNTVGGLISVTSLRPSLSRSSGYLFGTGGNYSQAELRGSYTTPIIDDKLGVRLGFGYNKRDGFSTNTVTGNSIDDRRAFFGKGQLLWKPSPDKEVRLILTGERDSDGDYAFNDLAAIRANPFRVTRDFEGFTSRSLAAPTLLFNSTNGKIDFASISGLVSWRTQDLTDLDYSIAPFATRNNREKDTQFTQEFRWASAQDAPVNLSNNWKLKWQAGVSYFKQNYDQNAVNTLNPPLGPLPGFQSISAAALNDRGVGAYGQATFTAGEKLDFIAGLRADYESKQAVLTTATNPPFGAPLVQNLRDRFTEVSPQLGLAYHLRPSRLLYGTISDGFKAGGFNPASPPGTQIYNEEKSRNYEIGLKNSWNEGRVTANLAAYYIDWNNLQLNVPFGAPGQFFISNVGNASSKGVELEVKAQVRPGLDLFAGGGLMRARFGAGSTANGAPVAGNELPFSPDYNAHIGAQYFRPIGGQKTLYARGEGIFYGQYQYDEQNTASQNAYALANFRAGIKSNRWFGEAWIRNAFNKRYVPIAIPYPGLAPSGFIGEPGAPATFGLTAGLYF